MQDEIPRLRVKTPLLSSRRQLQTTISIWTPTRCRETRLQVLGGARVKHPGEGGDEASAEHSPQEGGGHRLPLQELARSHVSCLLV